MTYREGLGVQHRMEWYQALTHIVALGNTISAVQELKDRDDLGDHSKH